MKNSNPFSYNEYTQIIKSIKAKLPILDYSEINDQTEEYCVIRHDIEFSLERALSIAKLEKEIGKDAIKDFKEMQLGDIKETYANLDSLEKWIEYKPKTSMKKGVKDFIKWYKNYYHY